MFCGYRSKHRQGPSPSLRMLHSSIGNEQIMDLCLQPQLSSSKQETGLSLQPGWMLQIRKVAGQESFSDF